METVPAHRQEPAPLPTPEPLQAHGTVPAIATIIEIVAGELLQIVWGQPIPAAGRAGLALRDGAEPGPKRLPHNADVEDDQETNADEKDDGSNDEGHRHDLGSKAQETAAATHSSLFSN